MNKLFARLLLPASAALLAFSAVQAQTYNGNGSSGFGGTVGLGTLLLTDNGATVSGTFTRGTDTLSNAIVIYLDTGVGGFADTSGFTDTSDGGRSAISGTNGTNRSVLSFPAGFQASYALTIESGFAGVFQLNAGTNHTFVDTMNLSPTNNPSAASFSFTLNLAGLGLTAGQGFRFVTTYISNSGFRSNESLGNDMVIAGQGWIPASVTTANTFGTPVPEPTTGVLIVAGAAGLWMASRRRRAA